MQQEATETTNAEGAVSRPPFLLADTKVQGRPDMSKRAMHTKEEENEKHTAQKKLKWLKLKKQCSGSCTRKM